MLLELTGRLSRIFAISAVLTGLGASGCVTPNQPAPPTPAASYGERNPSIWEVNGFKAYEDQVPLRSFTILGYIHFDVHSGMPKEKVFGELKRRGELLGGNAIIDIKRESFVETGEQRGRQDLGIRDIGGFGEGTVSERLRWRATVIYLPE